MLNRSIPLLFSYFICVIPCLFDFVVVVVVALRFKNNRPRPSVNILLSVSLGRGNQRVSHNK